MTHIHFENDPDLAIQIMRKASLFSHQKGRHLPRSWNEELLNIDFLLDDLEAKKEEFLVLYVDDKPIASGIVQKGDSCAWATWPTEKDALYGYKFASNPDYPLSATPLVFDALKQYAKENGYQTIRIDVGDWEKSKLRLYGAQGFQVVGEQVGETGEKWLLLEYNAPSNTPAKTIEYDNGSVRIESNPIVAVEIMKKAALSAQQKGRDMPWCWLPEQVTLDFIKNDLSTADEDFKVIYLDNVPVCSAVIQKGDKIGWAKWPTDKKAVYGYRYASNPDVPLSKTVLAFDALKKWAQEVGYPVLRIDIGDWEKSKLRLYGSQGFKVVAKQKDTDTPEIYLLLEYDPAEDETLKQPQTKECAQICVAPQAQQQGGGQHTTGTPQNNTRKAS